MLIAYIFNLINWYPSLLFVYMLLCSENNILLIDHNPKIKELSFLNQYRHALPPIGRIHLYIIITTTNYQMEILDQQWTSFARKFQVLVLVQHVNWALHRRPKVINDVDWRYKRDRVKEHFNTSHKNILENRSILVSFFVTRAFKIIK